uniref:Uncharacterized protein n=1 Tax=Arundo donax TaxID=35708 RepID=A0A0A9BHQ5_ARUDO
MKSSCNLVGSMFQSCTMRLAKLGYNISLLYFWCHTFL